MESVKCFYVSKRPWRRADNRRGRATAYTRKSLRVKQLKSYSPDSSGRTVRDLGYIVSIFFFAYPSSIDLAISRATHSDRSPSVIAYAAVPTQPCFLADWRASAQTVSCDRFLKRTLDGGLGYPTTCSYCIVGCLWLYIPVFRGITQIIWGCYSEGRTLSVWKLPLEKLFGIDDCFQLKDLSIYLYQVRCEYVITICLLKWAVRYRRCPTSTHGKWGTAAGIAFPTEIRTIIETMYCQPNCA